MHYILLCTTICFKCEKTLKIFFIYKYFLKEDENLQAPNFYEGIKNIFLSKCLFCIFFFFLLIQYTDAPGTTFRAARNFYCCDSGLFEC